MLKWAIHTIWPQLRRTWAMKERRGRHAQSLEDPERTKAKLRPEHWEKAIEEGHRPGDLGQDEEDELEDDEKAIDDCPEDTRWLIGNGATPG